MFPERAHLARRVRLFAVGPEVSLKQKVRWPPLSHAEAIGARLPADEMRPEGSSKGHVGAQFGIAIFTTLQRPGHLV